LLAEFFCMTQFTVKRLSSGGVITNYHCVSQCGHCLYNCGPHRPKNYLDPAAAEKTFHRIRSLGCHSVHIGGGEPLLNLPKLIEVLEAARSVGMGIDYVETNSAWFIDHEQAVIVLEKLLAAGVHTLLVSISPFHNAAIPFARVVGVIEACRRTGMQVFPWVNAFVRDLSRLDQNRTHSMAEFEEAFGPDYLERIPDRYWIHLGGRALRTFRPVYPIQPVDQLVAHSPSSCARALGDTSHFHIDLYGNYIPGLCAGLAIAMEELGQSLDADRYPLLHRLATTGIRGLYRAAVKEHGYVPLRSGFVNRSDLCSDIRLFLIRKAGLSFRELNPSGHYADMSQA
jgi:uncharacterized Fe-S cluster-containing radical SAM superfamily protein